MAPMLGQGRYLATVFCIQMSVSASGPKVHRDSIKHKDGTFH